MTLSETLWILRCDKFEKNCCLYNLFWILKQKNTWLLFLNKSFEMSWYWEWPVFVQKCSYVTIICTQRSMLILVSGCRDGFVVSPEPVCARSVDMVTVSRRWHLICHRAPSFCNTTFLTSVHTPTADTGMKGHPLICCQAKRCLRNDTRPLL